MQISKFARLLALTDAHASNTRASRKRTRFKPLNVNAAKFGIDWARQRSAAARMMALVLSQDSESLFQTVSADSKTAATFEDAVGWLESEAAYLRKFSNST